MKEQSPKTTSLQQKEATSEGNSSHLPFFSASSGLFGGGAVQQKPDPFFIPAEGSPSPSPIQTRLKIGRPNNPYGQQAGQIASQVAQQVNTPVSAAAVQRQEAPEEELQAKHTLQRAPLSPDLQREAFPGEEGVKSPEDRKLAARDKFMAYMNAHEKASQSELLQYLDELQLEFGLSSTKLDVSDPENVSVEFFASPALVIGGLVLIGGVVYHVSRNFERNYSVAEAANALTASEGRNSPETGMPGHPRMHATQAAAQTEANAIGQNKSCFSSAADQDNATAAALNTAPGQAALHNFDAGASTRENITVPLAIPNCHRMRPPTAAGVPRAPNPSPFVSMRVTLIIDKPTITSAPLTWYRKYVHIQTAYPRHT